MHNRASSHTIHQPFCKYWEKIVQVAHVYDIFSKKYKEQWMLAAFASHGLGVVQKLVALRELHFFVFC